MCLVTLPILLLGAAPVAAQPAQQAAPAPPPALQPGPTAAQPPALQPASPPALQPGLQPGLQPAPTVVPQPADARDSYMWQLLAADSVSLLAGYVIAENAGRQGDARFGDWIGSAWGLGMIGSVAVHSLNHRPLPSLAGTSMRLLVPPVTSLFGLLGYCVGTGIARGCAGDGARWGFAVGAGSAALLDALIVTQGIGGGDSRGWYGGTMLAIDALGVGLGMYTLASGRGEEDEDRPRPAALLATSHYLVGMFGAPWVHGANGHWLRALGSFGLRSLGPGLTTALGAAGYCAATGAEDGCGTDGAIFGLMIGSFLIATIDVAIMSWDERRAEPGASMPMVAPYVRPGAFDGVEAGILLSL